MSKGLVKLHCLHLLVNDLEIVSYLTSEAKQVIFVLSNF